MLAVAGAAHVAGPVAPATTSGQWLLSSLPRKKRDMSAPVALQPPGPGWGGGGGGSEDDVQLGGGAGAEPQHQEQRRTCLPAPRHFLLPAPDCC